MNNLNLLCQAIRFQRAALHNSLAMISAVQQHGEKFLKTTLDQSPWIPGQGKETVMFWAGLWGRGLSGATDMVDLNLATIERFTSPGSGREAGDVPPAGPAAQAAEDPPSPVAGETASGQGPEVEKPPEMRAPLPSGMVMTTAMTKTGHEPSKEAAASGSGTRVKPGRQPGKRKPGNKS